VDPDLVAAIAAARLLCRFLAERGEGAAVVQQRGRYDDDDFDADELGLDPEDDFDA